MSGWLTTTLIFLPLAGALLLWLLPWPRLWAGSVATLVALAPLDLTLANALQEAGKPFCLVVNISDPHKPFYAEGRRGETVADPNVPSKVFTPEELEEIGKFFDFDIPDSWFARHSEGDADPCSCGSSTPTGSPGRTSYSR